MSSPLDGKPDPRDPELVKAHSVLAREANKARKQQIRELAERYPDRIPELTKQSLDVSQSYEYSVALTIEGILVLDLGILFLGTPYIFEGLGAGLVLGGNDSWGIASFNYSLETMRNWEAAFQATFTAGMTEIALWGRQREYIGIIFAAGIGLGIDVISGGQGKFRG
jgi:hypothetical protein